MARSTRQTVQIADHRVFRTAATTTHNDLESMHLAHLHSMTTRTVAVCSSFNVLACES